MAEGVAARAFVALLIIGWMIFALINPLAWAISLLVAIFGFMVIRFLYRLIVWVITGDPQ